MRKEPQGRYASAEEVAADIGRYLSGQPVIARHHTFGYRVGKLIRRNRSSVAFGALIAASLIIGIIATTREARVAEALRQQAESERRRADSQARDSERHRRLAEAESLRAEQQREVAVREQQRANEQFREAQSQRDSNRRLLYFAEMSLADQRWQSNSGRSALDLLLKNVPKPGEEDLRGLEWYYLWQMSHTERATLRPPSRALSIAFSPDGIMLALGCFGMVTLLDVSGARE